MSSIVFSDPNAMVFYFLHAEHDVSNIWLLKTHELPIHRQVSPPVYFTTKQVLDEIEKIDTWITQLNSMRNNLTNTLGIKHG